MFGLGGEDRGFGGFSSATPSRGANRTATNQETISAIATTAKSENVYSPARARGEPDRNEARAGHEGAGQHRDGTGPERKGGGLLLSVALGERG